MKVVLFKPFVVDCNFKTIEKCLLCKTDDSQGENDKDGMFKDLPSEEYSSTNTRSLKFCIVLHSATPYWETVRIC
jgi:hypothetical protein